MQYLLMDSHHRFLGTFQSKKMLIVGDTFQNNGAQTYAVVGTDWGNQGQQPKSLTVMLVKPPIE
ncbi:MAG: hypothetical protein KME20_21410 [Kaiparowitsia implicata GSE-PSE-MK54-09C]|jgi:hypothetical protein|nr:hypothetical protein [Kaiparowitsia implicata GSE-PSE-MK54-09C]